MYKTSLLLVLLLLLAPSLQGQTSGSPKDYLDSSVARLQKGDRDGAISDLTKAIELNPRYIEALAARGQVLFLFKRDLDGALADYNKVIELAPGAPGVEMIYNNRATIHALKGDSDAALRDLNQAISLNPKYAAPYSGRANIRTAKGDLESVGSDYEEAIELEPYMPPAYIGRGILNFQRGKLSEALADFNKALELAPGSAKTYVERGIVRNIVGEIDGAIADIKKGFAINSESVSEKDPGNFSSPFKNINRFIASHPTNARAYEARGILRLVQGKKAESTEDFKKCLELDPKLKSEVDMVMNVTF
jgi:tetratricopeptide (TPR) repeat protein